MLNHESIRITQKEVRESYYYYYTVTIYGPKSFIRELDRLLTRDALYDNLERMSIDDDRGRKGYQYMNIDVQDLGTLNDVVRYTQRKRHEWQAYNSDKDIIERLAKRSISFKEYVEAVEES